MASRHALTALAAALMVGCAGAGLSPAEEARSSFESGAAASRAGRHEVAIAHFSRAVEIHPEFADAYARRGQSRLKRVLLGEVREEGPELQKAVEDLGQALRHFPLHFEAAYHRGLALAALSRYREAAQDFRHALGTSDVELRREAHARLAEVLEEKFVDLEGQALAHYEKYSELGGQDPAVLARLDTLRKKTEGKERSASNEAAADALLLEAMRLNEAARRAEAVAALEKALATGLKPEKTEFARSVLSQWKKEASSEEAAARLLAEARGLLAEGNRTLAGELLAYAARKYADTRVVKNEVHPLLAEVRKESPK